MGRHGRAAGAERAEAETKEGGRDRLRREMKTSTRCRTSRSKPPAQDRHRKFYLIDVIRQDLERCERGLEVVMRSPVHGLAETMAENRYTYERAATSRANLTPLWCRKTSANFVSAGRLKGTKGRNRTFSPLSKLRVFPKSTKPTIFNRITRGEGQNPTKSTTRGQRMDPANELRLLQANKR